jgi:hypothetical protein
MNIFDKSKQNEMDKVLRFGDFSTDRPFTYFCDMDGVLTAFEQRFLDISGGLLPDEYDAKYGKFSFWKLIETKGLAWWADMPWIDGGKEIWEFINSNNDAMICSSPSRSPLSSKGKMIWIQRELGIEQAAATRSPKNPKWAADSRIILGSQKYLFNKRYPNSILIDDTPKQINNWRNNGGLAVLHKGDAAETIAELKRITQDLVV